MAGLIALVQTDIKRVIAYSTMSQIGYMFVGAGLGAYSNAMFHLMTHAFFKALLFLAAGLAIHALAGEQDIRKLAGIGKLMPYTKIVFLIGSLALVGIPPFAGFFSKDSILAAGARPRLVRRRDLRRRADRRVPDRPLRVPALLHRLHRRADRVRARALPRASRQGGAALDALDGRRARAALDVGGFLQFAPLWHPLTDWLDPVARADRRGDERAGVDRLGRSRSPSASPASPSPGRSTSREARAGADGRCRSSRRSSTGTSSTTCSGTARPTCVARGLYALVERPLIAGSLTRRHRAASGSARASSAACRTASSAPTRSRSPAGSPSSPSSSWRSADERLADDDPDRPAARRRARSSRSLPLPAYWLGSLAALDLAGRGRLLDHRGRASSTSASPALQLDQHHSWFRDLGVSYHVGQYAFSLWLVGVTVVVMAACVIYGWWVGRERARAYFALMLLLTGAIVGVFTAQDLLLFYAFFEAMLIPLYVLIGVWGGAGPAARDADVRHLHGRRLAADARRRSSCSACSRARST